MVPGMRYREVMLWKHAEGAGFVRLFFVYTFCFKKLFFGRSGKGAKIPNLFYGTGVSQGAVWRSHAKQLLAQAQANHKRTHADNQHSVDKGIHVNIGMNMAGVLSTSRGEDADLPSSDHTMYGLTYCTI